MGIVDRRMRKAQGLVNVPRRRAIWLLGFSATLLLCMSCSEAADPLSHAAQSHIEANVTKTSDFDRFLQRDLTSYFVQAFGVATRVEYELLRRGPTQSGIAYPKYYAWVRIRVPSGEIREGAVRVAAIEDTRFEVTNFLISDQIKADGGGVSSVFPAPLISDIVQRATKAAVGSKATSSPNIVAQLRAANAESDARSALARGDSRLLAVYGYTIQVPRVPGGTSELQARYGLRILEGTSDAYKDSTDREFNENARKYASIYNRVVISDRAASRTK